MCYYAITMTTTFFSTLIMLILILDPFGNIPIFVSTLKSVDSSRRWKIIVREHAIAFSILLTFMFIGEKFLQALGLSQTSLQIAGGVILFLISIRMIFPPAHMPTHEISKLEPLIVPLAIPLIAGPSALATVMLLVSHEPNRLWTWVLALFLAVAISAIVLALADRFKERLGERFVYAMEKLMGLILVALSVEMLVRGIKTIFT